MDIIDVISLLILLFIFCKFGIPLISSHKEQLNQSQLNQEETSQNKSINKNNNNKKTNKYLNVILKSKHNNKKYNRDVNVNEHFVENQWHTDYRDTMNAFSLVVPNVKQLFNLCALPVDQISEVDEKDTLYLVQKFIKEINSIVKNKVSGELGSTSWIDNMPQQKIESGWDRQQKALGLPTSVYKDPAKKAPISLVKIDHSEKYETEKEIRYSLFLIVQKKHVQDQLVIKVNFVLDKTDPNLDRDFFSDKNKYKTNIMIEEISIIGYLTKNKFGERTQRDDFYQFDTITDGKMFSQEQLMKELNKKKAEYAKEMKGST